ncbi:MAG TPA: endoribonuclease MazF [Thermoanaerobaculia bacterium]|nr:endoribonuclease MazF [Thermoanaerobaculia bacterium]
MATKSGKRYTPDRGDMIWLALDPRTGQEQSGRRPAVVLSPASYNRAAGLAIVVPVTSRIKGYPFEVIIPDGLAISGAALADHLRSVDWRARKATRIGALSADTLREILDRAGLLLR